MIIYDNLQRIKRKQKIRVTKIRNTTKATDGLTQALSLKWKWSGHVARLQDRRWTKSVTAWRGPAGKRKKGDLIKDGTMKLNIIAGANWMQTASSRDVWHNLEEAFTCKRVLAD
ncbi:hypothetical protein ACJJTC_013321 [Scirpophaga incertulas]